MRRTTATAAASDALLDHAVTWTFESVASISSQVLEDATADRDLRDDPSLRPDAMTPQMHALLGVIARNRGARGLPLANGAVRLPPAVPARDARRYEEDVQESAERERRAAKALDVFLAAGTRNERRRARDDLAALGALDATGDTRDDSDDGSDDGSDDSDAVDSDADAADDARLHTFATVGLRAHEAASGHDVCVPWRDAPPPRAHGAAMYALLDAPTRRLIERAPPGSALDELSAHLASCDAAAAETAVQFCSALARCGCAYVKRGYVDEHASHYYVHALSAHAPLFLVSYVGVGGADDDGATATTTTTTTTTTTAASNPPLIDDQTLVRWRSCFFFCAQPAAALVTPLSAAPPAAAGGAKRGRHE